MSISVIDDFIAPMLLLPIATHCVSSVAMNVILYFTFSYHMKNEGTGTHIDRHRDGGRADKRKSLMVRASKMKTLNISELQ